jgi:hypothetical protein
VNSDQPRTERDQRWRAGFEFIEALAKVALAFAAIGYISLRAHLNSLGIPFRESVPVERYLMEMWDWVVSSLLPLVKPTCSLALLAWTLTALTRRIMGRRAFAGKWSDQLRRWWRADWTEKILLLVLAIACVSTALLVEQYCRTPIAVAGPLAPRSAQEPQVRNFYSALVIVWLIESIFWGARRTAGRAAAWHRTLGCVMVFIMTVQLPMLYGWLIRDDRYPTVTMEIKVGDETKTEQGVLVFETSDRFIVWRASQGIGLLVSYLRGEVLSVTAGASFSLRKLAAQAVTGHNQDWPAAALTPCPPRIQASPPDRPIPPQ